MEAKNKRTRKTAPADLEAVKLERQRTALQVERTKLEIARRKLQKLEEADGGGGRFPPFEATAADLGARLGIGEHAIAGLLGDPEAPAREERGYPVKAWGAYLLKRRRESPEIVALNRAKLDLQMETLRRKKLEADKEEGTLIRKTDADEEMRKVLVCIVQAIDGLRTRVWAEGGDERLQKAAVDLSLEVRHEIVARLKLAFPPEQPAETPPGQSAEGAAEAAGSP